MKLYDNDILFMLSNIIKYIHCMYLIMLLSINKISLSLSSILK